MHELHAEIAHKCCQILHIINGLINSFYSWTWVSSVIGIILRTALFQNCTRHSFFRSFSQREISIPVHWYKNNIMWRKTNRFLCNFTSYFTWFYLSYFRFLSWEIRILKERPFLLNNIYISLQIILKYRAIRTTRLRRDILSKFCLPRMMNTGECPRDRRSRTKSSQRNTLYSR